MQCFQYLARQCQARRHLGQWTEQYDDLELAGILDDRRERPFAEGGTVEESDAADTLTRDR